MHASVTWWRPCQYRLFDAFTFAAIARQRFAALVPKVRLVRWRFTGLFAWLQFTTSVTAANSSLSPFEKLI